MTTFTWKVANLDRTTADGKVNTVHGLDRDWETVLSVRQPW